MSGVGKNPAKLYLYHLECHVTCLKLVSENVMSGQRERRTRGSHKLTNWFLGKGKRQVQQLYSPDTDIWVSQCMSYLLL